MEAMSIPSNFQAVSDFRMSTFDPDRLFQFYDRMGFQDLKRRVKSQINFNQKTQENRKNKPVGMTGRKYSKTTKTPLAGGDKPKSNKFPEKSEYKPPPERKDFDDVPF